MITKNSLCEAASFLSSGQLVAFPTETVYGLGSDATNDQAVASIFLAKGRPKFNPLIVHVHDIETARKISKFDGRAEKLASVFWPGALTIVLPKAPNCKISLLATAGLDTLAIRLPLHKGARELIKKARCPIAAPSANSSGSISPTEARHVTASLPSSLEGGPVLILDDGPCNIGIESTVIDLSSKHATLLRPGGIIAEDIENVIGPVTLFNKTSLQPKSPGMIPKHYAPSIPIRLKASAARPGELLLAFGPNAPITASANLSSTGNLIEAAANFFSMLHSLDRKDANGIAVMPIPDKGLGRAINDRLHRAAS